MRITLLVVFILSMHMLLNAQSLRVPVSSAYELLNAYSKTQHDVFSFTFNSAALARVEHFSLGAFAENRFMTKEINHYSAVGAVETNKGNFGFQVDYFGFTNFNEYQLGLAYGRSLGANLDIGAQFNYYSYRIPTYPSGSAVTFQIGAIGRLSDVVSVGVQIYNPVGGYISKVHDEKLAANYHFGMGYEPAENVIISATVQKEEGRDLNVTGGVFYQFDKQFFARVGIRSENNVAFAAAGVSFYDMRLDISVSHHALLGFSPGVMLIYQPKKP